MKLSIALLALASTLAVATGDHENPPHHEPHKTTVTDYTTTYTTDCPVTTTKYEDGKTKVETYTTVSTVIKTIKTTETKTEKKPDRTDYVTTTAISYSTTLCPITETYTKDGKTETKTWTSTSVKEVKVPTTIKVEVTAKPTTIHKTDVAYTTETKLIPTTITKTKDGVPVVITKTQTSTIIKKVPTTIIEKTTLLTTIYKTTDIYTTVEHPTTYYTTKSAGSTIIIPVTQDKTVVITKKYTITSTFEPPTTKATVTNQITEQELQTIEEVITIPSERTATTIDTTEQTQFVTRTSTFEPPTTKATVTNVIVEQETVQVEEVVTIPSERTATAVGTSEIEVVETVKQTVEAPAPTVTGPPVVITRTRQTTEVEETVQATAPIPPPQTLETTVDAPPATTAAATSAPAFTGAASNNKAGFVALAGALAGFVALV